MTTDKDARRFAITVIEAMLTNGEFEGDINERMAHAAFVERGMYELALQDSISFPPLPEEERIKKIDGWTERDVLRISLEPSKYDSPDDYTTERVRALYQKNKAILFPNKNCGRKIRRNSGGHGQEGVSEKRSHKRLKINELQAIGLKSEGVRMKRVAKQQNKV